MLVIDGRLCPSIPNYGVHVMIGIAGFRPGERGSFDLAQDRPFVPAKVAKTMVAVAWPFGCPASFADFGGALTRGACPEP